MPYYVKKPVVIHATKFSERDFLYWEPWVQNEYNKKTWGYSFDPHSGKPNGFIVNTLEGEMKGHAGDYLVKGVRGELYVCRGDIFEETYKRVEGGEAV